MTTRSPGTLFIVASLGESQRKGADCIRQACSFHCNLDFENRGTAMLSRLHSWSTFAIVFLFYNWESKKSEDAVKNLCSKSNKGESWAENIEYLTFCRIPMDSLPKEHNASSTWLIDLFQQKDQVRTGFSLVGFEYFRIETFKRL